MRLAVVGISHHTAPLEVRERIALAPSRLLEALHQLETKVVEGIIVSTCNRAELYTVLDEGECPEALFEALVPEEAPLRRYLFVLEGIEAARHLFCVACGLDSLVFGESEILGQIRRSWEAAQKWTTAGPVTSRLFHAAVTVGKRARSQTDIGRFPASAASAAVLLARQAFGIGLVDCTVLVLGAGEVGQGVVRCLVDNGVRRVLIANHHVERAEALVERHQAVSVPWPVGPTTLAQADIIISCTGAPETVLSAEDTARGAALRQGKRQQIIDLAMPRDVEPEVARLPSIDLRNVDDLTAVLEQTRAKRQETLPGVEKIIEEATDGFAGWLRERSVSPTIKHLRELARGTSAAETQWALARLAHLSPRDRGVVEALASRLTNKLLHTPTVSLRRAAREGRGEEYRAAISDLFALQEAE